MGKTAAAVFPPALLAGIVLVTMGSFAYSYVIYRGEKKTNDQSIIQ